MDREDFLSRVRRAAAAGRTYRVHLEELLDEVGYIGASGDPCEAFVAEVARVGGQPQIVQNDEEARVALVKLLEQYAAESAYCWRHPVLDRLGIDSLLAGCEIERVDHPTLAPREKGDRRARIMKADVGITSADFAVAETGTLVMFSGPGREQTASLVPPVYIAIVERSQIVPDLLDVFNHLSELGRDGLPSNVTLITGPSKTGDIELTLTTGVHGPGKWHVLVLDPDGKEPSESLVAKRRYNESPSPSGRGPG